MHLRVRTEMGLNLEGQAVSAPPPGGQREVIFVRIFYWAGRVRVVNLEG